MAQKRSDIYVTLTFIGMFGYDFMNQFKSSPNLEHYKIIYDSKICKNSFSSGFGIGPYTC